MSEAILLVGGKGTRLRPLTLNCAKPMIPTAGVPFLTHQLARLRDAGVTHVVLATSYRAETFSAHFGDGAELGLEIDYVTETEPLGTGGGIRNVADKLRSAPDEPVVIFNGDVLSGHDIAAQVAAHQERGADVTLHLVEVDDPRAFGCVVTDESGRVEAFLEKTPDPPTNRINAGCYVFKRSVIDGIPEGRPVSVERETFPGLLSSGALVLGHVDSAYWLDLGTPAAFVQGSRDLVTGRIASTAVPGPTGEKLVLPGGEVAIDAKVSGGTTVGAGAVVGRGAVVEGSVLLDGAVVEEGAVVRDSVVGAGASIGAGAVLEGVVVGEAARIGARNELLTGVRVWAGAELAEGSVRFSSDAG
ncbi:nucleotidyltransferase [Motilibacter rhizosphaerae]|uniref:Nucleotidyltransferase n=1 Tax=Motilibacter rhizosphaerae TaxID=598652 RepID=A0A4V2F4Q9_9ACTN|nr:NDP-sugar synthase [Motilibacter rhizosphaerae]RZS90179.1 nucleotidyltransferase [Motilibacter rhizosphaerae]